MGRVAFFSLASSVSSFPLVLCNIIPILLLRLLLLLHPPPLPLSSARIRVLLHDISHGLIVVYTLFYLIPARLLHCVCCYAAEVQPMKLGLLGQEVDCYLTMPLIVFQRLSPIVVVSTKDVAVQGGYRTTIDGDDPR